VSENISLKTNAAKAVFCFVLLLSRQLKLTANDEYSKAIITKNVSLFLSIPIRFIEQNKKA